MQLERDADNQSPAHVMMRIIIHTLSLCTPSDVQKYRNQTSQYLCEKLEHERVLKLITVITVKILVAEQACMAYKVVSVSMNKGLGLNGA